MDMGKAIKTCFRKYATFTGRARRSEFWFFYLFNYIISIALSLVGTIVTVGIIFAKVLPVAMAGAVTDEFIMETGMTAPATMLVIYAIVSLYSLAAFLPGLAVTWRRLHDIGKSGAHYFLGLIPLVGPIILLVWLCRDSQPGDNRFGPNPKAPQPWEY